MTALTRECLPWLRVLVRMPRRHAMDSDCMAAVVRITPVMATPAQAPLGGPHAPPDTPPPARLRPEAQGAAQLGQAMALSEIEREQILADFEDGRFGPTRCHGAIPAHGSGIPKSLQVRCLRSDEEPGSPKQAAASLYGIRGRDTR